jgi:peptidoglycan/LPS O-acetylase OafA/YrhL
LTIRSGGHPRAANPAAAGAADTFSPELEGLRGLAILVVVIFHAHLFGVGGGFVGVDVFFVLSGFLITGLLVREAERDGRISLERFYARRAKRILPAALTVLAVTVVLAVPLMPSIDLPRVAGDAAAAALSVGNIVFAFNATDYFSADQLPSPVLHYWSLGVEEQFYLLWPGALVLCLRFLRGGPRRSALLVLLGVFVTSLIASIVVTDQDQPLAFFLLPTRAWQLALGGLLAVSASSLVRLPAGIRRVSGWAGLAAVVVAAFVVDPASAYPGAIALLPCLGAAAIILASLAPGEAPSPLRWRPIRFLGLISFSLYLVHWPVFIFAAANNDAGGDLPTLEAIGLVGLSVVLGWLSYRFIEAPFHRGRRISALRPRQILAPAGVAIAVVCAVAIGVSVSASLALDAATTGAAIASDAPTGPTATLQPSGPPATSGSPTPSPSSVTATAAPVVLAATGPLPRDVTPSLGRARDDWEQLHTDGCTLDNLQTKIVNCVYGDPKSSTTVVLVGDSHASQWFPALQVLAEEHDWRLIAITKFSCRFMDLPMYSLILHRYYSECETWKPEVLQRLQQLKPDLVIVSAAHDLTPINPADSDPVRQGKAMARYLTQIPGKIAVIVDTPISAHDMPVCLSRHLDDVSKCSTPRATGAPADYATLEQTATAASGATLVDMTDAFCNAQVCPAIINDMIVFRDTQHMTATFAASLADLLFSRLPALGPATPTATP